MNVGFLWALAYMFLLAVVFAVPAWWVLKGLVRWVLCEPRLRWRQAGWLVGVFVAAGVLATLSEFLGGSWGVTFAIVCFLSSYVVSRLERRGVL